MEIKSARLAICLVTSNAGKYLPFCLNSLMNQDFKDFIILVIDNGSSDDTVKFFQESYPNLPLVRHPQNLGYAKAHNQGIAWTKSEYFMPLNQDIILEPNYLSQAVAYLDNHPQTAAISGKLYYWDFNGNIKTKIIDTAGLKIFKNHRVVEIGQGQEDDGQFEKTEEVFGVSGAAPIYRRSALEQVKIEAIHGKAAEYFDEDFFSYKEDVDLAYRFQLAGYSAVYLPSAVAYHDRTTKGNNDLSDKATRLYRKGKDRQVKIYSYKNHLSAIYKNEFVANLFKYFWPIFFYECKKLIYLVIFEPATLKGLSLFFKQKKKMSAKRKYIIKNIRKISSFDLVKWFN
ncbi:MAG: glycosyltransferase family 2 protein [Patescibacteria group bacterium]|jgi:GT2 family glycosyltransferase